MNKTPSRPSGRSRPASPKTPFGGLNDRLANLSVGGLSPEKGDISNPFIVKKSSLSPVKSGRSEISFKDHKVMNAVDSDWIEGDSGRGRASMKSSSDRFIPQRTLSTSSTDVKPSLLHSTSSSTSVASTSSSDFLNVSDDPTMGPNQRILSFSSAPPSAPITHDLGVSQLRQYTRNPTAHSASGGSASTAAMAAKDRKRRIPTNPERVLDAPGLVDDYYLNLLAWSSENQVAVGLGDTVYVWSAETGEVAALGEQAEEEGEQITSLEWSPDGMYLAVGNDKGEVEIWDVTTSQLLRRMRGHASRVPSLSWHGHLLSSGCRDGSIHHNDVRIAQHKVQVLQGHTAEVCGLKWRGDGGMLASGGNDNVVNCWDARLNTSTTEGEPGQGLARWTKRNHTAAVKALAWCPWQNSLLATGGGTGDQTIHFWNSTTGARLSSLPTSSQVTSLLWSPNSKEILSTHGFPDNTISLWSYPGLQKIWDVSAHDTRVLVSALSPDGCTVATGASDENLKFWKVWDPKAVKSKTVEEDFTSGRGTSKGGLKAGGGGVKIR